MNIRYPLPASYQAMNIADLRESMNVALHQIFEKNEELKLQKEATDEAKLSSARWQTSYEGAVRENKNQQAAYNLMKVESEKNADLLSVRDSEIAALQAKLVDQEEALIALREKQHTLFLNRHENEVRHLWSTTFTASIGRGDGCTLAGTKAEDALNQFNRKFQPKQPPSSNE